MNLTEKQTFAYTQDIGTSILKCEVIDYKSKDPLITVKDTYNDKINIIATKSRIVKTIEFLNAIIEKHDASTKN